MDVFLCSTALAQSIGRWGNFFNSEAFGLPTDLPWKLFIPISHRPMDYINVEYFHPTFLYESILDLAIFLILVFLFPKLSKKPGTIACLYLILYSVSEYLLNKSGLIVFWILPCTYCSTCLNLHNYFCVIFYVYSSFEK